MHSLKIQRGTGFLHSLNNSHNSPTNGVSRFIFHASDLLVTMALYKCVLTDWSIDSLSERQRQRQQHLHICRTRRAECSDRSMEQI